MEKQINLTLLMQNWLTSVRATERPAEPIAAFYFGLTETEEEEYSVHLAGFKIWNEKDDEWAAVVPEFIADNYLLVPMSSYADWYWFLLDVIYSLGRVLRDSEVKDSLLGDLPAYTGFVGGDLFRII